MHLAISSTMAALAVALAAASQPVRDATLVADLQSVVRGHLPVGAVLGRSLRLHTVAPHADQPLAGSDRRDLVAGLAARWKGTFTVADGDVVRLASADSETCRASLAQRVDASTIHGNASEVLFQLAVGVDPTLASLPPPGLVSGGGSSGASTDLFVGEQVQLAGGRITVDAALDQIVTRESGLGWWAAETCVQPDRCRCDIGLVAGDSLLFGGQDITPAALERRRPDR